MTAISIALVLCVAMMCATRIHLRSVDARKASAEANRERLDVLEQLRRLGERLGKVDRDLYALCASVDHRCDAIHAELDKLKANAAFRSLG